MSYRTTDKLGTSAATGDGGEGSPIELDPLGGSVGTFTPYLNPNGYHPTHTGLVQPFDVYESNGPNFTSLYAIYGGRTIDLPGFGTNWGSFADFVENQYQEGIDLALAEAQNRRDRLEASRAAHASSEQSAHDIEETLSTSDPAQDGSSGDPSTGSTADGGWVDQSTATVDLGTNTVTVYGNGLSVSFEPTGELSARLSPSFIQISFPSGQTSWAERFKKEFFQKYGDKLNECIRGWAGSEFAKKIPEQTIQNAPSIDLSQTIAQLNSQARKGTIGDAGGLPYPKKGKNGTVAIANDIASHFNIDMGIPENEDALVQIQQGIYAHEIGNILAFNVTGDFDKFGDPKGIGTGKDTDSGATLQKCIFGNVP